MFCLVFLLLALSRVAVLANDDLPSTPAEWAACPHQRNDAVECANKYCDLNHDGYLCWEEIVQVKRDLLTVLEKFALFFAAPDQIMRHCAGGDDLIGKDDFAKHTATCLRNCKAVKQFFEYVCDRAVAQNYTGTPVECSVKPPRISHATAAPSANDKARHHAKQPEKSSPHERH